MMNTLKQDMKFFVSMFPECCLLPENFSIELTVEVVVGTQQVFLSSWHRGAQQ